MATDRRSPDRLDRGRNSRNFDCSAVLRFLLTPRSFGTPCGILPCCPYFVLLNSRIGKGQTLGKRAMHLQVVNACGEPISVSKSFIRYLVLSAPFFLTGLRYRSPVLLRL